MSDRRVNVDMMGLKEIPQGMQLIRVKNNVSGQFEEMIVPMDADIIAGDPSLQQEQDDQKLLKNTGDSYSRIQKGTIMSSDGETVIPVDLTFIRIRNSRGGIDVICQIPPLGMTPDTPLGKA